MRHIGGPQAGQLGGAIATRLAGLDSSRRPSAQPTLPVSMSLFELSLRLPLIASRGVGPLLSPASLRTLSAGETRELALVMEQNVCEV